MVSKKSQQATCGADKLDKTNQFKKNSTLFFEVISVCLWEDLADLEMIYGLSGSIKGTSLQMYPFKWWNVKFIHNDIRVLRNMSLKSQDP